MKLIRRDAPHIRHSDNNKTVMGDIIISILPLYVMAFCFYGARVGMLLLTSLITCVLADVVSVSVSRHSINLRDFSPVVTALIIPMLFPATASYSMVMVAGIFAILVAKAPFGGVGQNIFNPAAAGVAFSIACYGPKMFLYPLPFSKIELFGPVTTQLYSSTSNTLKLGGIPNVDFGDMLLGILQGPMGATSVLVILACLLYLSYRRTVKLVQPLCFIGAAAFVAYCFPRVAVGRMDSVLLELMSGSLLFVAVFMLTDPVTSPKQRRSCALYGAVAGVVAMLFRRFGGFEQTAVFAILIMNVFASSFDGLMRVQWRQFFRKKQEKRGVEIEA